ncbi:glycine zipper domain-containing protein [Lysobacter korlensis]|uniref:Glycine zipper domain-containing protein n=1 Tax=Lysobacter korlensis TaxID=553636 RepID=A0ABV6S0V6_9GAMM
MSEDRQSEAKANAVMGPELKAQEAQRLAHEAKLERAAAGRRSAMVGLVGAALGAVIGHFLVTGVSRPALVGALVGLLAGRLFSRLVRRKAG